MLPIQLYNRILLEQEERKEMLKQMNLERRFQRCNNDPFFMPDDRFVQLFRLTKDMVQNILMPILVPGLQKMSQLAISPIHSVLIALNFFASGSYQRTIGDNFNCPASQQTVSNIIKNVSSLIVTGLANEWIKFPRDREDINIIKQRFMEKTRFPGVLGAIDCTHITIIAPSEEEHAYLNRKGYHSKNVQIICDYDLQILNINARHGGATHDAFIFRNSTVCEELERRLMEGERNTWLLGDSGYPQKTYLMTPIIDAIPGTPEFNYTTRHIHARNCVERCNGVFKARFRCLCGERKLRYSPESVGEIINACAILHNICIKGRLPEIEAPDDFIQDDLPQDNAPGNGRHNQDHEARRLLIQRYF